MFSVRRCLSLMRNHSAPKNQLPVFLQNLLPSTQSHLKYCQAKGQEIVQDNTELENEMCNEVFSKVNRQIEEKSHGRLFAVVQIESLQYKITTEDIIVVKSNWAPTNGDKIRLEKVLLVGASDFTLIGRPLLALDQVAVYATVIEKTLSHTLPLVTYKPRKNNARCNFLKYEITYLRITDIDLIGKVNELGSTDGFKDRIF